MKIKELEQGMLLTPIGDNECFAVWGSGISGDKAKWVRVRTKPSRRLRGLSNESILDTSVMMYLGTKKDLNLDVMWTDKFVLIDNEIAGVDPSSWRRIKQFSQKGN